MTLNIRPLKRNEHNLLKDFLYEAIFIPEGATPPPRSIVDQAELAIYYTDFGKADDVCFLAEVGGKVVGAAWARIMHDYGHVDDETQSLSVAVFKDYRGQGIGTALMKALLAELKARGYKQTSLSVQKANPAWRLYRRLGFEVIRDNEHEWVMVKQL